MSAFFQSSCSVKNCHFVLNKKPERLRMIIIKNKGYWVCEKCFQHFEKIGQLIIK